MSGTIAPAQAAVIHEVIEALKRERKEALDECRSFESSAAKREQKIEEIDAKIKDLEGQTTEALEGWVSPDEARAVRQVLEVALTQTWGGAAPYSRAPHFPLGGLIAELIGQRDTARNAAEHTQAKIAETRTACEVQIAEVLKNAEKAIDTISDRAAFAEKRAKMLEEGLTDARRTIAALEQQGVAALVGRVRNALDVLRGMR